MYRVRRRVEKARFSLAITPNMARALLTILSVTLEVYLRTYKHTTLRISESIHSNLDVISPRPATPFTWPQMPEFQSAHHFSRPAHF